MVISGLINLNNQYHTSQLVYSLCDASESAKDLATSPQGLLEYLLNFFTFGGVHRELEKRHQMIVLQMGNALSDAIGDNPDCWEINQNISFSFFGSKVTFEVPNQHFDAEYPVTVWVEGKGGVSVQEDISRKHYSSICTLSLLQVRNPDHQFPILLTDEGAIDLSGEDLRGVNLNGIDLSGAVMEGADLQGATLVGANLAGVSFIGANLLEVELLGVNLQGAKLPGEPQNIKMALPQKWDARQVDKLLNHALPGNKGSLLTMIDSIDESQKTLKLSFARELMESLERDKQDFTAVVHHILQTFYKGYMLTDSVMKKYLENLSRGYYPLALPVGKVAPTMSQSMYERGLKIMAGQPREHAIHFASNVTPEPDLSMMNNIIRG